MSVQNDPDEQFSSGMNMIQRAYETQTSQLTTEINHLNQEIESKELKLEEYEAIVQKLMKENKRLNQTIEKLTEENNRFKSLNGNQHVKVEANTFNYAKNKHHTIAQSYNTLRIKNSKIDNIISSLDDSLNKIVKTSNVQSTKHSMLSLAPMKRIDYSAMNIHNTNANKSNDPPSGRTELTMKSKAQINTDFFKTCRASLKKVEYSQLIDIIKMSNSKIITKKETYSRIENLLDKKHNDLFNEFKDIFQFKDIN